MQAHAVCPIPQPGALTRPPASAATRMGSGTRRSLARALHRSVALTWTGPAVAWKRSAAAWMAPPRFALKGLGADNPRVKHRWSTACHEPGNASVASPKVKPAKTAGPCAATKTGSGRVSTAARADRCTVDSAPRASPAFGIGTAQTAYAYRPPTDVDVMRNRVRPHSSVRDRLACASHPVRTARRAPPSCPARPTWPS